MLAGSMKRTRQRVPKQARARETVTVILVAARRVLKEHGARQLSTNRVAHRAGVSIGTLYEYFPNKEAILVALAREQLGEDLATMLAASALGDDPLEAWAERTVKALVALHAHEDHVRRVVMSEHLAQGLHDEHAHIARVVVDRLAELDRRLGRPLSELQRFVVSRAVLGAMHAALREKPELLRSTEFERALVDLTLGALTAVSGARKPST
jgi:AcrR family transcriptional regulator